MEHSIAPESYLLMFAKYHIFFAYNSSFELIGDHANCEAPSLNYTVSSIHKRASVVENSRHPIWGSFFW